MSKYKMSIGGSVYEVEVQEDLGNSAKVSVNGVLYDVEIEQETGPKPGSALTGATTCPVSTTPPPSPTKPNPVAAPVSRTANPGVIKAPMPGMVLEVMVKVGQRVQAGDVVVRLEAMKMENDITTTVDGVVKEIKVQKGAQVQEHDTLLVIGE